MCFRRRGVGAMQKPRQGWSGRSWPPSVPATPSWSRLPRAPGWDRSSRRWCAAIPSPQRPNRRQRRADRMFFWLANSSDTISVLNVFRYITTRTGGSMFTAGIFVFLFGPTIINRLRSRQGKGQPIRPDGPQSHLVSKTGAPTMGGLMSLSGFIVSTVLWANPGNPYVWVVLGVTLGFGSIGFYDDYLKVTKQTHAGISGRTRLVIEFLIAGAACYAIAVLGRAPMATSLAFPFFKDVLLDLGWFFVIFGAFVVVGAGNAVNLTDGLAGLAFGPAM